MKWLAAMAFLVACVVSVCLAVAAHKAHNIPQMGVSVIAAFSFLSLFLEQAADAKKRGQIDG